MAEPSQMAALKIPMARRITSTRKNYRLAARKPSGEAEGHCVSESFKRTGFSRLVREKRGAIAVCNSLAQKKSRHGQKFFERQSTCAIYSPLVSLFV
jgi:hypothetical protein